MKYPKQPYITILKAPKGFNKKPLENLIIKLYNDIGIKNNLVVSIRSISKDKVVGEYADYDPFAMEHLVFIDSLLFKNLNDFCIEEIVRTLTHEMYHCRQFEQNVFISEYRAKKAEDKYCKKHLPSFKRETKETSTLS